MSADRLPGPHRPRVLLVDDEEGFRVPMAERLELRGFDVVQADSGEAALRLARADRDLDVVVLDFVMPGMDGGATLAELRRYRPEVPVVMLTAHGSVDRAAEMGRRGAFRFLAKPVPVDELAGVLREADREHAHALARRDTPLQRDKRQAPRLRGPQRRTVMLGVILAGLALLLAAALLPPADSLVALLDTPRGAADAPADPVAGYAGYDDMAPGETIAAHYVERYGPPGIDPDAPDAARRAAGRTQLMIALIAVAALFWATGAVPIGATALLVAVVMYAGGVMRPDAIGQAFAKDAVVFIFGVLALSRVMTRTGLDKRVAMLLLRPVRGPGTLLFVFLPVFALACSFISETILVTLVMPMFLMVWQRLPEDGEFDRRSVLVLFALVVCYASNLGGPGSPAAGGRNAIMIGILADYGQAPTFLEWMRFGLPFVPVAALALGLYLLLAFGRRLPRGGIDAAGVARRENERLGPLTGHEKATAAVALLVVAGWLLGGARLGMGGPVLAGLVLLNLLGVADWRDVTKVPWDVVFLYGGASALGRGLADSGGALYLARGFLDMVPADLMHDTALPMVVSLVTGVVTNFMSDGATVAALGPIAVPMAEAANVHPWIMGFATAFASSFAHMLIIGTPASALVYILCRDPRTGRQLVSRSDFLKHGAAVWVLSFAVLWGWAILGYWRWLEPGN